MSEAAFVYRSPVKHSVTIAGHETAITLEPIFWSALRKAAEAQSLPLNALIARIDVERIANDDAPNLASAIRQWLMAAAQSAAQPMSQAPIQPGDHSGASSQP